MKQFRFILTTILDEVVQGEWLDAGKFTLDMMELYAIAWNNGGFKNWNIEWRDAE